MRVVTLASRKGGAGKTTLACHLAVEAERAQCGPVAIIDLDDMQGISKWWDARAAETPILAKPVPTLAAALKALEARGIALVFIDTAPALDQVVRQAIRAANLVLVPVQPSPDDLRAVGSTVQVIQELDKPMLFVINRVKPREKLTAQVVRGLSQHGTVAMQDVWDRTDYKAAKTDGRTAPELDPGSKAATEIIALWAYINTRLGASHGTSARRVA